MLTEEALILFATLGASGLLVLGVVELVWPARPRRAAAPRARPVPGDAIVARRLEAAKVVAVPEATDGSLERLDTAVASTPSLGAATDAGHTVDEPAVVESSSTTSTAVLTEALRHEQAAPPITAPASSPMAATPRTSGETRPHVLPIETCRAMYDEGRFAEVVSLGSAALEVHAGLAAVSHRPYEAAALLDLLGLSKQALGDLAGAGAAFEAAVVGADPAARPSCIRHLVAVVGLLVDAEPPAEGDTARVRDLRACLASLDRAMAVAPDDEDLLTVRASVREVLATASERLASKVGAGGAGDDAQQLVLAALADSEMPASWRERLRDELTAVSSAEIGQLTAQAIRLAQEGKDIEALAALERAERLSEALPAGAVTEERREEFERRLWWGYSKVALRRIETESYESALEPLFRALRFGGADAERAVETRGALVRALEGVVETGASDIARLGAADPRVARTELDRLWDILREAGQRGVPADELADLFAALRDLQTRVSAAPA